MKKTKALFTILLLLFIISCKSEITEEERADIYERKGYNEMKAKKRRLKPEIIEYGKQFYELAEVSIPNTIATIDGSGSFALMEFDERGKISINPILPGFPGLLGMLKSDSEHNVLWLERGRGVYFLDIETKKTGHIIANNDGNSKIMQTMLLDPEKKLFMIATAAPDCGTRFFIYDLLNDKLREEGFENASVFPFYDGKMLGVYSTKKSGKSLLEWDISDYEMKKFEGTESNKLTKELTKLQINVWHKTKVMHLGRRMMLGTSWAGKNLIYYSIRWDEEIDEIKIEPIVLQHPKEAILHDDFTFSANGNWVQTLYTKETGYPQLKELIIYHAASVYPQGLSMPIYCGYTKEGNEGAFMQHDQWGSVYVERDQDMRDKLFIYKLNDGLEILKEQALDVLPSGDKE